MLAAPALAAPVATPSSVAFNYAYTPQNPGGIPAGQTVTVADDTAPSTPLAATVKSLTQPSPCGSPVSLFVTQQQGNAVFVALDQSVMSNPFCNLISKGGTYTGSLVLTTSKGDVTVPLSLSINANTTLSANTLSTFIVSQVGGISPTQTLTISSGGVPLAFTVAPNQTWIVVSPNSGTTGSTSVSVYVNSAGLPVGQQTGSITVTAGGQTLSVPVTACIASCATLLTLSPNALTFNYASSAATATTQPVYATTSAAGTSYIASVTSGNSWLSVSNSFGSFIGGTATINVVANPVGTTTGVYYGTIQVTSYPDNSTGTITVTMNVGTTGTGGLTFSPSTTLSFTSAVLNSIPQTQYLTVNSSVSGITYSASVYSGGNWLSITNGSGFLSPSATLAITVNSYSLTSGTYTGQILFSTSGSLSTSQIITVNLVVGTGGGGGTGVNVAPTSMTFYAQAGAANRPGPQYIALGGSGGLYSTTLTTTSGGNWLSIAGDSSSGNGPTFIPVTVNSTGLSAGTYNGQIVVTYGGVPTTIPITLSVTTAPVIVGNVGSVVMNTYGGTVSQPITVFMSDNSSQTFTAASSSAWFTVNPTAGSLPSSLSVSFDPTTLPSGISSGTLTITAPGAANSPLSMPVLLNNLSTGSGGGGTGTNAYFSVTPASLTFNTALGTSPNAQAVYISSSAYPSLTWSASATMTTGSGWLSVSPANGPMNSSVIVSVNASGLAAGTYSGSVVITSVVSQTIPVTLTVTGSSVTLTFSPTSLSFEANAGGANPASQTIAVNSSASTTATVSATTSSGGNWLSVSPTSGTPPFNITVTPNVGGLQAGTYSGTIAVTPANGTAQTIPVTFVVRSNPTVTASPASITFNYRAGDAAPNAQQIQVTAQNSTTPLTFSASAATTSGGSWLSVTPNSGTTPGTVNVNVTPGALDPGTYSGTVTVAGTGGAGGSTTIAVTITVTAPLPTITRVVNNASYASGALAPGEIVTIAGTFIGPTAAESGAPDSTNRFPTTLGGVQVLFNGIPGPILYVSNSQINAIVPYTVAGRLDTFVQVRFRGNTSNTITLPVTSTAPGVYTLNSSGTGPGAILNENGSVNGSSNAAARGSVIVIYATGEGLSQNASGARPEAGQIVTVANINDLPRPLLPVAVLIDGQPATVTYAGSAPGQVAGLLQINAIVPSTANAGAVPVVISVGSNSSQQGVTVSLR